MAIEWIVACAAVGAVCRPFPQVFLKNIFQGVRKIWKSDYQLRRLCLSISVPLFVCPHGTARMQLEGFS
jgi:hypothetical protein